MNASSIAGAIAAGLATFLLVGMTVTELLARRIEFAVLVGFPAGALAGAVAVALVASGFVDDAPAGRRRLASAAGAFAITFLVAFVAGVALPIGFSLAIAAGVVLGVGVAVGAYLTGGGRAVEAP